VQKGWGISSQIFDGHLAGIRFEGDKSTGVDQFVTMFGQEPSGLGKICSIDQERDRGFPLSFPNELLSNSVPFLVHARLADLGPKPALQEVSKKRVEPILLTRSWIVGNRQKDVLLGEYREKCRTAKVRKKKAAKFERQ
jgi:hypothetical protein